VAIIGRLNKLVNRTKPLLDRLKKQQEWHKQEEEVFLAMNLVMTTHFPEHPWSKLPYKKKLEIFNRKPQKRKKYFRPNNPIPFFVPVKVDKYAGYYSSALRVFADFLWEEIQRRKEEKFLKNDAAYKRMKSRYNYK